MKVGDKFKVIDHDKITQTYMRSGSICEFVKSFDSYACVRFEGREYLMNKQLLVSTEEKDV